MKIELTIEFKEAQPVVTVMESDNGILIALAKLCPELINKTITGVQLRVLSTNNTEQPRLTAVQYPVTVVNIHGTNSTPTPTPKPAE